MSNTLSTYQKKKDFLVCVDSDGCAMDTMDIKHIRCFGPCMVTEWGLEEWKETILTRWNEINLYTMTRGINRYKGLSIALTEINEKYTAIEALDTLTRWVEESPELSNGALEKAIAADDSISLKKALSWSKAVNASINQLPDEEKLPFEGVKEALAFAHERWTWRLFPAPISMRFWKNGNATACLTTRILCWPRTPAAKPSVSENSLRPATPGITC